ncbi:hypothetical protein SAMN05660462_02833 [Proteiniborus ethanoligenes]|uniref:Cas10/Cmr2 second palm domain-containing protein n=1 Tax=Proteiniborus ethanoligenes TaxID=415015 RepID=A0A1H3SDD0_9FIRM|nr:hypothetical protein [Proteiniborus ethanoligenes]SDZ35718.1 hypothetical protein SAMN05660462_02833 [Proteiniborus ethanoligenes]
MRALVLWEVSKKQQYIFSSNKLKENRGASIIIEDIVEKMPYRIELKYKDYLIYNGGGSSLYNFPDTNYAKEFIRKVSKKVLKEYPGIELFMVLEEYDEEVDPIIEKIDNAYKNLAIKKNRREYSGGQLSFGIERLCESTGLPASHEVYEDDRKRYISSEIKKKTGYSNKNADKFDNLMPVKYSIKEFGDLTDGDKNYLAVVHIDGNQMGKKLNKLKEGFKYDKGNTKETNNEYLRALKKFSDDIKDAFEGSFKHMANIIKANEDELNKDTKIKEGKFPLIPIIIAGDDITYVTNGKIGIESARVFLEYLNKINININGEDINLNACAGVAITKASYPFSKTYALAEDLCSSAKKKILKDYANSDADYSLIDWHIEQGDIMGSISDIREAHYKSLDGNKLNIRPLYLNNDEKWTSYSSFLEAYEYITKLEIDDKKAGRSKIKTLREILKKGERNTELYLSSNKLLNYFPRLTKTSGNYCFYEGHCVYYDVIEAMDLFIPLKGGK